MKYSLYSIQCNWSAPYVLSGIAIDSYNINITSNGNLVYEQSIQRTEFTYNVSELATYTVSIAAVIGSNLKGQLSIKEIKIATGIDNDKHNEITNTY